MVMRKKALWKDTMREVVKTKSRFFSILAIVAIGTAFFSGVKVACYDMKNTAAAYFNDQNLFDFKVMTNYGIDEETIAILERTKGVEAVMPGYAADLFAQLGDYAVVVKAYSYNSSYTGAKDMNRLVLIEGRMPETANECVVERSTQTPGSFAVGQTITFFLNEEGALEDILATDTFTIVGVVRSPMYISIERGRAAIGSGGVNSFVYLHESAFVSEIYTEAYIKMTGAEGLNPFEADYAALANAMERHLEQLMPTLAMARYNTIVDEATKKIEEGEAEIADAEHEIADAERKIEDGLKELADAQRALENAGDQLNGGRAEADAQFAAARQQLEEGEQQLELLRAAHTAATEQLALRETDIINAEPVAQAIKVYLAAAAGSPEEAAALAAVETTAVAAGYGTTEAADLKTGIEQYKTNNGSLPTISGVNLNQVSERLMQEYINSTGTLLEMAQNLVNQLGTQLQTAEAELAAGWAQYNENYASTYAMLDAARAQIDEGWRTFNAEKVKALKEIEDARRDIEKGKKELAEGRQELADARRELEELAAGKGYTFDRDNDEGYAGFDANAERVDAVAVVFPVFFILVAALVCLTTMTRMVEDQRTQIGTVKALGYSSGSILAKYLLYAGTASAIGAIIGVAIGLKVLPMVIYNAYSMMYFLPDLLVPYLFPYFFYCTVASVLTTCTSAYFACRKELKDAPAALMRPKAPPDGKRVLLERITFIWNRLTFSQKVTMRNLARYKKRVAITVVGIAGCTALLMAGFGVKDSVGAVVGKQFVEVATYDAITVVNKDAAPEEFDAAVYEIENSPELAAIQWGNTLAADFSANGRTYTGSLVTFANPEEIKQVFDLHTRAGGESLKVTDDCVIVSEKITQLLGLSVGDTFTLSFTNYPDIVLTVGGINENYVMHYAYITPAAYRQLFGEEPVYNMGYVNFKEEVNVAGQEAYAERVLKNDTVLATSFARDSNRSFANMVGSLDYIVAVIIVSAGALALVVLYNLTNINITERTREIATIKVLGFYDGEVASYIYRENIVCTILGILAGILLGLVLHQFIILTVEVDMVMFSRVIEPLSYLYSAILTAVFSMVVNLTMYFKLKKIDMVLSLKSVE